MKKFTYRSSLQRKKNLKYGGYASITTIILLVCLVLVNVLFSQLNLKLDLTVNSLYTPSSDTMDVLDQIEDDVVIYGLYNTGTEETDINSKVIKLIEAYADLSDRITFKKIDPLTDPTFANQFLMDDSETLDNGSLVVQNQATGKFKTVALTSLYEVTSDYSTLTRSVTGFSAEQALSSAIQYVCITDTPVLYQLQGHSETLLTDDFVDYLSYTNFTTEEMNIVLDNISELEANTHTVVLVNNPRQDLSDSEYEVLLNYMESGGRMLFMAAYDTPDLPNFERLLSRYGMSIERGLMVETSTDYYYTSPMIIKPILDTSSSISSYLVDDSNNYVIMTLPAAINISDEHTNNLNISAIVTTSDNAIIKADGNGSVVKEDGDIEGPFNLCVVAQENLSLDDGTITSTKLIVIANSDFIDTSSSSLVTTGNYKLTTIICDYLQDSVEKLYISSKSLEEATIETSQTDFIFYGLLYTVAIPFVVIIIGVVIWVRRKHL
jgi:hypothetical protein